MAENRPCFFLFLHLYLQQVQGADSASLPLPNCLAEKKKRPHFPPAFTKVEKKKYAAAAAAVTPPRSKPHQPCQLRSERSRSLRQGEAEKISPGVGAGAEAAVGAGSERCATSKKKGIHTCACAGLAQTGTPSA